MRNEHRGVRQRGIVGKFDKNEHEHGEVACLASPSGKDSDEIPAVKQLADSLKLPVMRLVRNVLRKNFSDEAKPRGATEKKPRAGGGRHRARETRGQTQALGWERTRCVVVLTRRLLHVMLEFHDPDGGVNTPGGSRLTFPRLLVL